MMCRYNTQHIVHNLFPYLIAYRVRLLLKPLKCDFNNEKLRIFMKYV